MKKHTYAYITVPAEMLNAALTKKAFGTEYTYTMPVVCCTNGDHKKAILDSYLLGLDAWYKLGKNEYAVEPESNLLFIKTSFEYNSEKELPTELDIMYLLEIPGEPVRKIPVLMADKYAAACRAFILDGDDSTEIMQLTTKQAAELYLENYLNRIAAMIDTELDNITYAPMHAYIESFNKVFNAQTLTQIEAPEATDTVIYHSAYIAALLHQMDASIQLNNLNSEDLEELPCTIFLEHSPISFEANIAPTINKISVTLLALWLSGNKAAEQEVLQLMAEDNIKVAKLLGIKQSINHILNTPDNEDIIRNIRINIHYPRVVEWFKKVFPEDVDKLMDKSAKFSQK